MIEYERKALQGVPDYRAAELLPKRSEYCLLIPVINEGARILTELGRAQTAGVDTLCDIVICDGGSTDGSMKLDTLQLYGVNTLLTKTGPGKQGAQLRMGIYFALNRGYKGVLTIDGNNKDSIEDVHKFIEKLQAGYDFVQGSRFIRGGHAVNTPPVRYAAVRLVHAPLISLVIAVTALIPIFGSFLGCAVGVLLILTVNPGQALWFIVLFLCLQQIEGNFIYPRVVGNSVGLPAIWVLAAVTVGGSLVGIVGMLLFIPQCSVLYALLRRLVYTRLRAKNIPSRKWRQPPQT